MRSPVISSPILPLHFGPMKTDPFKDGHPNPLGISPVIDSRTNLIDGLESPSPALLKRYRVAY